MIKCTLLGSPNGVRFLVLSNTKRKTALVWLIQSALEELTNNKTVIMIAHRLKTVQRADQILVINKGHIKQRGTHGQLMQQGGLYADFVNQRKKAIGWKI